MFEQGDVVSDFTAVYVAPVSRADTAAQFGHKIPKNLAHKGDI
jgi:hypothetical protein